MYVSIIVLYSVFTHVSYLKCKETIRWTKMNLQKGMGLFKHATPIISKRNGSFLTRNTYYFKKEWVFLNTQHLLFQILWWYGFFCFYYLECIDLFCFGWYFISKKSFIYIDSCIRTFRDKFTINIFDII